MIISEKQAFEGYEHVLKRMDISKLPPKTIWMLGAVWASEVTSKELQARIGALSSQLNVGAISEAVGTMMKENPDAFLNPSAKG